MNVHRTISTGDRNSVCLGIRRLQLNIPITRIQAHTIATTDDHTPSPITGIIGRQIDSGR
ncbi:hypothetical protein IIF46_004855 [Salmonella enterica]|nr:hypothetical protein [Salmonella enterica]